MHFTSIFSCILIFWALIYQECYVKFSNKLRFTACINRYYLTWQNAWLSWRDRELVLLKTTLLVKVKFSSLKSMNAIQFCKIRSIKKNQDIKTRERSKNKFYLRRDHHRSNFTPSNNKSPSFRFSGCQGYFDALNRTVSNWVSWNHNQTNYLPMSLLGQFQNVVKSKPK